MQNQPSRFGFNLDLMSKNLNLIMFLHKQRLMKQKLSVVIFYKRKSIKRPRIIHKTTNLFAPVLLMLMTWYQKNYLNNQEEYVNEYVIANVYK